MVRYIQITQVPPQRMALWRSWLSPQRRKRAERMPDDRETVCGEGLARELLAAALHCPPEEAPLRYDAQGKPLTDGLYLSISHSRGLAACAVADRPVGLDVELVRPAPRRVWEHLSPEERSHAADDAAFFRLWTAKEALLKCRGGRWGQLREPASFLTLEGFALPGYAFSPVQLPEGWTGTLCLAEKRT